MLVVVPSPELPVLRDKTSNFQRGRSLPSDGGSHGISDAGISAPELKGPSGALRGAVKWESQYLRHVRAEESESPAIGAATACSGSREGGVSGWVW